MVITEIFEVALTKAWKKRLIYYIKIWVMISPLQEIHGIYPTTSLHCWPLVRCTLPRGTRKPSHTNCKRIGDTQNAKKLYVLITIPPLSWLYLLFLSASTFVNRLWKFLSENFTHHDTWKLHNFRLTAAFRKSLVSTLPLLLIPSSSLGSSKSTPGKSYFYGRPER